VIWQGMKGLTEAGWPLNKWQFDSQFVLASWQTGAHRLSARAERFSTTHVRSTYRRANSDGGNAWTAAYGYQFSERWSLMAESLWIRSRLPSRARLGAPVQASERQLQLALRLEL
jgi:hypothetical protein